MKSLTVVTSCAGYGEYLGDWARSIAAQTSKPAAAVVVVHGTPADTQYLPAVRAVLEAAGIPVTVDVIADRLDLGVARNRAVALADTPWVMHLDADDMLMPHALEDAAALADGADVIAFGYERSGDLAAGPTNRIRLYRSLDGLEALDVISPCSGVSPFRKALWERAPYRAGMLGAWDTALWLGFARLGARFRPTKRPAFWYRQHADSVFNRRRLTHDWTRAHVQAELAAIRADRRGVSVIIPHRSDKGGPRDLALAFVRTWYARETPDFEVVVGNDATAGEWNKGAAVRDGLARATGAVLIIADGDCLVDPLSLMACLDSVNDGAPWAIPHRDVYRLAQRETQAIYAGGPVAPPADRKAGLIRPAYEGYAGGGFIVVRRDRWTAAGGIPLEFTGWGGEDEAAALVLTTLLGEPVRFDVPLIHLWHPPGDRTSGKSYTRNREILARYRAAAGNVPAMFALVTKGTTPDATPGRPAPSAGALEYERRRKAARDRTLAIRADQQRRNEEQTRLAEAALAAARARRLDADSRRNGTARSRGE